MNYMIALPTPTREGYRFVRWIHNGEQYMILFKTGTEDVTLTAVWEKLPDAQKESASSTPAASRPTASHTGGSPASFGVPNGSSTVTAAVVQSRR